MKRAKKKKELYQLKRCNYSNKPINNKEVVIVEYAVDYVEKMLGVNLTR